MTLFNTHTHGTSPPPSPTIDITDLSKVVKVV
jgi:hypothetical protein